MLVDIPEVQINECPRSYITDDSLRLLEIEARYRAMKDATGAAMFGTDVSKHPAWWVDLVSTLEQQRSLVKDHARKESEKERR